MALIWLFVIQFVFSCEKLYRKCLFNLIILTMVIWILLSSSEMYLKMAMTSAVTSRLEPILMRTQNVHAMSLNLIPLSGFTYQTQKKKKNLSPRTIKLNDQTLSSRILKVFFYLTAVVAGCDVRLDGFCPGLVFSNLKFHRNSNFPPIQLQSNATERTSKFAHHHAQ